MQNFKILIINPGSTSTKVALFQGCQIIISQTIGHTDQDGSVSKKVIDQLGMREKAVRNFIDENLISGVDAVVGRGGLLKPLQGGTYRVNANMCRDLEEARYGEHASNLGPILARRFGDIFHVPAYIVDPVTVDEYEPSSRISGVPGIERKCRTHALNIKSVSRRCAKDLGKDIENTTFIVAHLGGGISVCALEGGRIIDSTDALLGEGPFSMERAGTLPLAGVVDFCFDKGFSKKEVLSLFSKQSGFKGYIGTDRFTDVLDRIHTGDKQASRIFEAMVMQTVKWIGGMIALVKGKTDAVILTGGMANSQHLTNALYTHISPLAEVRLYPGEFEMEALAEGVLRVLQKSEASLEY
ncbi:MAG: butyrate kinase [Deltaproteobacteria bacterium]|nr:butyrate kinase [Deltaproteobacteria bacterium]